MQIRPYEPSDLDDLVRLWRECDLTRPWNDPASDIAFCLGSREAALFVGALEGELIASVMVGHDGHRGWVYYMAVAPRLQGRGLGRMMMQRGEVWLEARGVAKAMLMVRATNREVIGFYQQLGYTVEERVLMARWLKPPAVTPTE